MSRPPSKALTSQVPDIEIEVADVPADSISALAFCPVADYLAAASWNNEVWIYEIGAGGQAQRRAAYAHEAPALSVAWSKDGSKVFSGGADKVARMLDANTGQSMAVARHDDGVKAVKFFESPAAGGLLVTGSWDQTIRYWDLRSPTPAATVALSGKCYALDVVFPLMVIGTSQDQVEIFDLNAPTKAANIISSPLKKQMRVATCFPTADGFAVGSVEGRVALNWIEPRKKMNDFAFRCHRKEESKSSTLVYAVNDVQFHPVHGTFATAGSDGTMSIWNGNAKSRTKNFPAAGGPISSIAFNSKGTLLAYAVSYDWSKGHIGMVPGHVNKILIHQVKDEEVKRKKLN